jgi:hypothetical protein
VGACCPIDPANNEPNENLPDGSCCADGYHPAHCTYTDESGGVTSDYWVCCDYETYTPAHNECTCCPNCCTDITHCSVHAL